MLDVVIPHLNSPRLENCITSLLDTTPNGVIQSLALVDQSGQERSFFGVDFHVKCAHQVGFARAANLGMSLGRAPYVLLLNDDCTFLDSSWWYGILKTFETHNNLLCVNPSSPYNPGQSCPFSVPQHITKEKYAALLKPDLLDGICMWAPVFSREQLAKVPGSAPGLWFDERFWPGGGEDYDMNRRAALVGLRCVGTGLSWVWHWWHTTKVWGQTEAKYDGGTFQLKWSSETDTPDIFGERGLRTTPPNKTLEGGVAWPNLVDYVNIREAS